MCHYITMVVGGVSEADLNAFMLAHGRKAKLVFNASVQKVLMSDESHFLTTKGQCDCGTALGGRTRETDEKPELAIAKLKAKGWSQAKIDRWVAAKDKSAEKAPRATSNDSIEFWAGLLRDLKGSLSPTSVGLLLHYYSGGVGRDKFAPRRVDSGRGRTIEDLLETMREDELTILSRAE